MVGIDEAKLEELNAKLMRELSIEEYQALSAIMFRKLNSVWRGTAEYGDIMEVAHE